MSSAFVNIIGLETGYQTGRTRLPISKNLNLKLNRGELVCLLGANGAGKSTLLRTLVGLQKPLAGKVFFDGKKLEDFPTDQRASLLGLVLTGRAGSGLMTVGELVLSGRLPYTNFLGRFSEKDFSIANSALESVGLTKLKNRTLSQISDGEHRKTMIARLIAQKSQLMILDEPSAYLDFPGKIEVLQLLKSISSKGDVTALLSTHDVELSLKIADRIWLIDNNGDLFSGVPEDLIFSGLLGEVFNRNSVFLDPNSGRFEVKQKREKEISVKGNSLLSNCLKSALNRKFFQINNEIKFPFVEIVSESKPIMELHFSEKLKSEPLFSIEEVLLKLEK